MNRVKENKTIFDRIAKDIHGGCLLSTDMKVDELITLGDISKSLAVIADKLSKSNDKCTCDGCRHNIFLDGDDVCCTCSNYYSNQYES